ncbi:MAG: transposase [candidate division Zixibacteria bacterium]
MTNIRRYFSPGQVYFLTHVTYKRKPILIDNADLLKTAIYDVKTDTPFEIIAFAIMPDHFHIIIDPGKSNLSTIFKRIKLKFSTNYRKALTIKSGRIWQNRFWDHQIRNQDDLNAHIDYIHYNPVKHGLVNDPFVYKHSSLPEFYDQGLYGRDWGVKLDLIFEGEFGE